MKVTRLRACLLASVSTFALITAGAGQALAAGPAPADPGTPAVQYTVADLGTLGGTNSSAAAADDDTVVGTSQTTGNAATHAFAYNRHARTMTDLGTLGGTFSTASAVSGHTVVGQSRTAGNAALHGYAYNLLTHARTDLGRSLMISQLVSGNTAVGGDSLLSSTFNLATHAVISIGPGNGVTEVSAIKGDLIVGNVFASNSFAFSFDMKTGAFTNLPALGGLNSTASQSSCSGIVVGKAALPPPGPFTANGPFHAAIWVTHTA